MHILEAFEPIAWLIAGVIVITLVVIFVRVWIIFPFKVLKRLDELVEANRQMNFYLASLNQRLGAAEITHKEE